MMLRAAAGSIQFLSTPSARRATHKSLHSGRLQVISIHALREEGDRYAIVYILLCFFISIHALREEGDLAELQNIMLRAISIHALREEGDYRFIADFRVKQYFYPRPPRGGRPRCS